MESPGQPLGNRPDGLSETRRTDEYIFLAKNRPIFPSLEVRKISIHEQRAPKPSLAYLPFQPPPFLPRICTLNNTIPIFIQTRNPIIARRLTFNISATRTLK